MRIRKLGCMCSQYKSQCPQERTPSLDQEKSPQQSHDFCKHTATWAKTKGGFYFFVWGGVEQDRAGQSGKRVIHSKTISNQKTRGCSDRALNWGSSLHLPDWEGWMLNCPNEASPCSELLTVFSLFLPLVLYLPLPVGRRAGRI